MRLALRSKVEGCEGNGLTVDFQGGGGGLGLSCASGIMSAVRVTLGLSCDVE